jgi:hypothetical protein
VGSLGLHLRLRVVQTKVDNTRVYPRALLLLSVWRQTCRNVKDVYGNTSIDHAREEALCKLWWKGNSSRLFCSIHDLLYRLQRGFPEKRPHPSEEEAENDRFEKKNSVPLQIPATPLFCSCSIPKTWVNAQSGNDRRPTLIRMHKHSFWANPRTGAYAFENLTPSSPLPPHLAS